MSAEEQVQLEDFGSIFSLEGKVAVVTGGSRGLGLHAASGYVEIWKYLSFFSPLFCCLFEENMENIQWEEVNFFCQKNLHMSIYLAPPPLPMAPEYL